MKSVRAASWKKDGKEEMTTATSEIQKESETFRYYITKAAADAGVYPFQEGCKDVYKRQRLRCAAARQNVKQGQSIRPARCV